MPGESRLKVLLSAYACEPNRGSEPGVGWNWTLQLACKHDVWVLVWSRFQAAIEAEMARRDDLRNVHFVFFELPRWARPFARTERLHYSLWQLCVLPLARRLQRQAGFDVVHHLTFNTVEMPGVLWAVGPPFVWGPVGGGQVPPGALKGYFQEIWPVEMLRAARKRLLRLNPFLRLAASRAARVLVVNRDTQRCLEPFATAPMVMLSETAVRLPEQRYAGRAPDDAFTILWWGNLIPRKGPLLALDVAAELKRRGARFRMPMGGVGAWQKRIAARIEELGLQEEVSLLGYLTYDEMSPFYDSGDVFLFTSLQDTSGNVVLEAMSHRLPVVSLDHHGAAEMLTRECGVKVPIVSQQQVIEDMATALESLAGDAELRWRMGEVGRERVASCYQWDQKGEVVSQIYRDLTHKPDAQRNTVEAAGAGAAK